MKYITQAIIVYPSLILDEFLYATFRRSVFIAAVNDARKML